MRPPVHCFNTQPPEGGWGVALLIVGVITVSTHSRPKAAGSAWLINAATLIRFNTQPPEGGWDDFLIERNKVRVFQHTAARRRLDLPKVEEMSSQEVSTHSRPKAAGNRLRGLQRPVQVSTHSRPKAAGGFRPSQYQVGRGFNTQPPEGGWKGLCTA